MKKKIAFICGIVALGTTIGGASEFNNNITNNGWGIALATTALPFAALVGCIYFIVKGGK
jgi:hypothetical protein